MILFWHSLFLLLLPSSSLSCISPWQQRQLLLVPPLKSPSIVACLHFGKPLSSSSSNNDWPLNEPPPIMTRRIPSSSGPLTVADTTTTTRDDEISNHPSSPTDVRLDLLDGSSLASDKKEQSTDDDDDDDDVDVTTRATTDNGSDDDDDDDENNKIHLPLVECRNLAFELGVRMGNLFQIAMTLPLDASTTPLVVASAEMRQCCALLLACLLRLCLLTRLDLETCIHNKMALNRQKYPVELCKGKAGKYTQYSSSTGITKHKGQSTLHLTTTKDRRTMEAKELFPCTAAGRDFRQAKAALAARIPSLRETVRVFAEERDWNQYHTPRNLCLAMMGEVGELCELWQFRGDQDDGDGAVWKPEKYDKLGQEIADVAIYLIRLVTVCQIDLDQELLQWTSD